MWNVRRCSRTTTRTFMSSATGRSTPVTDRPNDDADESARTADSQCRLLQPLTCLGWAAGRSTGRPTTVRRRQYMRQEKTVLQLCCRHSWRGGHYIGVVNTTVCDYITRRAAVDGEQQRPEHRPWGTATSSYTTDGDWCRPIWVRPSSLEPGHGILVTPNSDYSRSTRFYCASQISIVRTCYGDLAGWQAGWVAGCPSHVGVVSKHWSSRPKLKCLIIAADHI